MLAKRPESNVNGCYKPKYLRTQLTRLTRLVLAVIVHNTYL